MIYDRLTPLEYLEFVAGLWEVPSEKAKTGAQEILGVLGLEPHAHERCEGFSKGMRQKVALAGALIHEPKLIILDEPLTGLDAGSARLVKDVLLNRVAEGCTVILTTHILEVAERMAQRIGVIAEGRLVAEGTLEELRAANHASHGGKMTRRTALRRFSWMWLPAARMPARKKRHEPLSLLPMVCQT